MYRVEYPSKYFDDPRVALKRKFQLNMAPMNIFSFSERGSCWKMNWSKSESSKIKFWIQFALTKASVYSNGPAYISRHFWTEIIRVFLRQVWNRLKYSVSKLHRMTVSKMRQWMISWMRGCLQWLKQSCSCETYGSVNCGKMLMREQWDN